jgi:putative ABC transport system permease protein
MLRHYLAIALRNLKRAPLTAAINVATLSLGLVAFVAAYAVVTYWRNSDRHFANVDRTYVITASLALRDGSVRTGTMPQTNELYERYLRVEFPELEAIARANVWNQQASVTAAGRGARVAAMAVDPEFLEIFDLPFIAGDPRTALSTPDGVVLTEAAALRLFAARDVLGKTVTLGGNLVDATVTGVIGAIPEPSHMGGSRSASLRFDIMAPYDLYERLRVAVNQRSNPSDATRQEPGAPSASTPGAAGTGDAPPADAPPPARNENWLGGYCCTTYVMLKRDSRLSGKLLDERLEDFAARRMTPEQLKLASVEVGAVPLAGLMTAQLDSQLLGSTRVVSIATLLFGLGVLVLLVACVNYANLATARAARRAREIGLRKAMGARRTQLVVQHLLEAGVLMATALAVAIGVVMLIGPLVHDAVGIDMRAATARDPGFSVFVGVLLIVVTFVGGSYPALVLSRVRPIEALRLGRVRLGPRFASTALVGSQFAAASFLLISVIVMYSQNSALERTALGTTRDQHLVIDNFRPVTGVDTEVLRAELERLPQVEGVTEMGQRPWSDGTNLNLFSRTPEETASPQTAFQNNVGYDFFSTLDIPVLAGRAFDREHNDMSPQIPDDAPGPRPTVNIVIDRVLAEQLGFGSPAEAIDQTIYFPAVLGQPPQPYRVIGVVENHSLYLQGFGATSNAYELRANMTNVVVRLAAGDVRAGVAGAEAIWRRLAPQAPFQWRFMDEIFNENFARFRQLSDAFVGLAAFAFFISVVGLFGMAVQVAGRRVHEIGVRRSLGARRSQIVRMLLRDFSRPVVIANLAAWPLGYFAAKAYLGIFMQRITLTPLPFVASLAIVVAVAWAAVGGQAWRAARANPASVLRVD